MTENTNSEAYADRHPWPEAPDSAAFCAMMFVKLGGTLAIGSDGRRYAGRPMPYLFQDMGEELPQLPGAAPHEQFQSEAEWEGAVKLLGYSIQRLSPADTEFIYAALAAVAVNEAKPFDFREKLQ